MPDRLLLEIPVEADALRRDVDAIPDQAWVPHFNTNYYTGQWSGVPLRQVGGRPDRLYPEPSCDDPPSDTPVLAACPAIGAFLATLRCPTLSVRLLRLAPGAAVREHRDYAPGYEGGEVRLHVPVHTGPGAEFWLSGTLVPMAAGQCWYVDVNAPHSVANRGRTPRVHLVIDARVDKWLEMIMRTAAFDG